MSATPDGPAENPWELICRHTPNGLVALDGAMRIKLVNPAFCRMFRVGEDAIIDLPGGELLGDLEVFQQVLACGEPNLGEERSFPELGLHVHLIVFPVPDRDLVACICVDRSLQHGRRAERFRLKQQTIAKVQQVVDNQMKVAQEIASLLGETTADTKASLLKLIRAIESEM